jgi:hypothetical protein
MIDHCVCTYDGHSIIKKIDIGYHLGNGDHLPIFMYINMNKLPCIDVSTNNNIAAKFKWNSLAEEQLECYGAMTDELLSTVLLPTDALMCEDAHCVQSTQHKEGIESFYDNIVNALLHASGCTLAKREKCTYVKPGWNEHVRDLYDASRSYFHMWCHMGKPRFGPA